MNTQKHFFGIGQNRIGSSNTNRKYSNITPKIVSETLLRGKSIEELTYSEFLNRLKELRQKTSFAQIVGNYGIYKYRDKKQTYYHAADLRTNLDVLTGRKTIKKIISDIQKGDIEYLKRQNPNMFDPRYMYQLFKRSHIESEKYSERVKRFALKQGQKVLDLAAGDYPDLRATHAIDLKKPSKSFKGLNYKYGYNFNKETIKLPYSNNYFDIVVSIGGLGRNFESQKIYNEIYRILKPGGSLEFNPVSRATSSLLNQAGFRKIFSDSYFDSVLNQKVHITVSEKQHNV